MTNENTMTPARAVAIKAQISDTRRAWLVVLAELGAAIRAYNNGKPMFARLPAVSTDDRAMSNAPDAGILQWVADLEDRVALDVTEMRAAVHDYLNLRAVLVLMRAGLVVEPHPIADMGVVIEGDVYESAMSARDMLHADTSLAVDNNAPNNADEQAARESHNYIARRALADVALPHGFSFSVPDERGMNTGGCTIVTNDWEAGLYATYDDDDSATWELSMTCYDDMGEVLPFDFGPVLTRSARDRAASIMRDWIAARVAYVERHGARLPTVIDTRRAIVAAANNAIDDTHASTLLADAMGGEYSDAETNAETLADALRVAEEVREELANLAGELLAMFSLPDTAETCGEVSEWLTDAWPHLAAFLTLTTDRGN